MRNTRLLCTTAIIVALVSCGSPSLDGDWAALRIQGDDAEHFETLQEMAAAADGVVTGRFTRFSELPSVQGDAEEDSVTMVAGQLEITSTLAGATFDSPISLEFVVAEQGEPIRDTVDRLLESFPREDLLVFVREKRDAAGHYRTVNSYGLWAETVDGLMSPLGELTEASGGPFADEVGEADTIEDLGQVLETG